MEYADGDDHGDPLMSAGTQEQEHKASSCSSVKHLMQVAYAVRATQAKRKASESVGENEHGSPKAQALSHDVLRAAAIKAREMMLGDGRDMQELLAEFGYSSANGRLLSSTTSFTPLQRAVMQGHEETAKALIDADAAHPFAAPSTQPAQVQALVQSSQKPVPARQALQVILPSSLVSLLLPTPVPSSSGVKDLPMLSLEEKIPTMISLQALCPGGRCADANFDTPNQGVLVS